MYIDSSIWKLILSYASSVCVIFMWYWLFIYFGIKKNGKEDLDTYLFFKKLLLKSALFILIIPCAILFVIGLIDPLGIIGLWGSIVHNLTHKTNELLLLLALSVFSSCCICVWFYSVPGEHIFKNGGWKTYFTTVFFLIPIIFLFTMLIFNFNLITLFIIIGFIGLIISGKIIGL